MVFEMMTAWLTCPEQPDSLQILYHSILDMRQGKKDKNMKLRSSHHYFKGIPLLIRGVATGGLWGLEPAPLG